jgi:hypothetical protein
MVAKVKDCFPGCVSRLVSVAPSDILGTNRPIGIELELEYVAGLMHNLASSSKYWHAVEDHSLYLKGIELVSQNKFHTSNECHVIPIAGKHFDDAMNELEGILSVYAKSARKFGTEMPAVPRVSDRTSNHIHIGVLDFDDERLYRLYCNYVLLEPILFGIVATHRTGNIYCYPAELQFATLNRLKAWPRKSNTFTKAFYHAFKKYEALNLKSVADKGTVEFRMRHGEYNVHNIINWTKILLKLVEYDGMMFYDLWPTMNYARCLKYAKIIFGNTIIIPMEQVQATYRTYEYIKSLFVGKALDEEFIILSKFLNRVNKTCVV